jgi:hypothetical protein
VAPSRPRATWMPLEPSRGASAWCCSARAAPAASRQKQRPTQRSPPEARERALTRTASASCVATSSQLRCRLSFKRLGPQPLPPSATGFSVRPLASRSTASQWLCACHARRRHHPHPPPAAAAQQRARALRWSTTASGARRSVAPLAALISRCMLASAPPWAQPRICTPSAARGARFCVPSASSSREPHRHVSHSRCPLPRRIPRARAVVQLRRLMSKSCSGVLEEYIKCVEASGCVSASGRAVKDCARDSAAVPECAKYREARARYVAASLRRCASACLCALLRSLCAPDARDPWSACSCSCSVSAARWTCARASAATRGTSKARRAHA